MQGEINAATVTIILAVIVVIVVVIITLAVPNSNRTIESGSCHLDIAGAEEMIRCGGVQFRIRKRGMVVSGSLR